MSIISIWLSWDSWRDTAETNHTFNNPKMTQRILQLTQHGRSLVIWFIALNSLYTFFSTFEKALAKSWYDEYVYK